jgi:hypothetical protein
MTPVLKVETPLLLFIVGTIAAEHANRVLVEMETKAERVMGSFEGPYAPRPLPSSEASHVAKKKWKAEVSKKLVAKRAKAGPG